MSGGTPAVAYGRRHLPRLAKRFGLDPALVHEAEVVSLVLPFRVSEHVVSELIDWSDPASDPLYRLTFPRRGMLAPEAFAEIEAALERGASRQEVEAVARAVRAELNPDPAGQHELNVPRLRGEPLAGTQHKYPDTLLYFPAEGQTCHAYCSYCFRWPQFTTGERRFATRDAERVASYVREHPEIKDVLLTGGDPLVMRASVLRRHLEPFLAHDLDGLTLRIGTKALSYHPSRFLGDRDADELLALIAELADRRGLSVMAHYSHPRELEPEIATRALHRVLETGATVRCQAPLLRGVNDDPGTWSELWAREVRAGAIPYYMFVERDTGARRYFEVPLLRALAIYRDAIARSSGLAATARGPVMSATPGKVLVDGVIETATGPAFVLKLLRARDPRAAGTVELAELDPEATWLSDLRRPWDPARPPFSDALPGRPEFTLAGSPAG